MLPKKSIMWLDGDDACPKKRRKQESTLELDIVREFVRPVSAHPDFFDKAGKTFRFQIKLGIRPSRLRWRMGGYSEKKPYVNAPKMKALSNGNVVTWVDNTIRIFEHTQRWKQKHSIVFYGFSDVQEIDHDQLLVVYQGKNMISIWNPRIMNVLSSDFTHYFFSLSTNQGLLSSTGLLENKPLCTITSIFTSPTSSGILIVMDYIHSFLWYYSNNTNHRLTFLYCGYLRVLHFLDETSWILQGKCQDGKWVVKQNLSQWKHAASFASLIQMTRDLLVGHVFSSDQLQLLENLTGQVVQTQKLSCATATDSQMKRINDAFFLFQCEHGLVQLWHVNSQTLQCIQELNLDFSSIQLLPNHDLISLEEITLESGNVCFQVRRKRIPVLFTIPRDGTLLEMDRILRQNSIPIVLCDLMLNYLDYPLKHVQCQIQKCRHLDQI